MVEKQAQRSTGICHMTNDIIHSRPATDYSRDGSGYASEKVRNSFVFQGFNPRMPQRICKPFFPLCIR